MLKVKVKKLHDNARVPKYQSELASGFDFYAIEDSTIEPGETKLVRTGLAFEIPEGFELQVRPRSGMSLKTKLRVANSPGTVDADYRGEVSIIAENIDSAHEHSFMRYSLEHHSSQVIEIKKGDRIAQGVICPIIQAKFEVVEDLSSTDRGEGGFGSTGFSSKGVF